MRSLELVADCSRCAGLCCVLLPFRAADGFGRDKGSGTPCHHLDTADRCGIHATLREDGWPGCTVFDCFGAGQHVTQTTYGGSWRDPGANLGEMAAVLSVVRLLHEALSHLVEVERRAPSARASELADRIEALAAGTPAQILAVDLDALMPDVAAELRTASQQVRGAPDGVPLGPRPDLAGRDLRGRDDLLGADLHGALLIAADLRGLDLGPVDLLGADLRDADVRGCDLSEALFLTQSQVNAAVGDGTTRLPLSRNRPGHWLAGR